MPATDSGGKWQASSGIGFSSPGRHRPESLAGLDWNIHSIPDDRFFIDKVGLQFPSAHLNGNEYRLYEKGSVTLLKWGDTARVLFHDELLRQEKNSAMAILKALVDLAFHGVFDFTYGYKILLIGNLCFQGSISLKDAIYLLLIDFKIDEMELTIDLPGIEFLAQFNPEVFTQVAKWTFYSKSDFKRKRRGASSKRAGESKGVQKSFFTAYRKDLQVGLDYPLYRIEFRFSGEKYKDYLYSDLLFLTPEEVYGALLPTTNKVLNRLKIKDAIEFNPLVTLFPDSLLAKLLKDLNWFEKRTP